MANHPVEIGPATQSESDVLAAMWHSGWIDGHADSVAPELVALRTASEFARRMEERIAADGVQVARFDGTPAGFFMVVEAEVEQIYVDRASRGAGVAQALLTEAERQIGLAGHDEAWLAVVAGNDRARAFYTKRGWRDDGPLDYQAAGPEGPISVPSRRYAKRVAGDVR